MIVIIKRVRRRQMAAEMCPHWNIACYFEKAHGHRGVLFLFLIFSGVFFFCKPLLTKKLIKMAKCGLQSDKTGTAQFKYKAFLLPVKWLQGDNSRLCVNWKKGVTLFYSFYFILNTCSHFGFRCFKIRWGDCFIFLVFFPPYDMGKEDPGCA